MQPRSSGEASGATKNEAQRDGATTKLNPGKKALGTVVRAPRLIPVAILVLSSALLLSGCSSAPAAAPSSSASPALYTVTASPAPVARLTTDTFHLLARPDMTPRAPTASEPIRVPVDSFFTQTVEHGANAFQDTWDTTLAEDVHGFSGNATLQVEVTGTLVSDPRTGVFGPGCFWALSVVAGSYETGEYQDLGCVKEGPSVATGLHTLEFPFALTDVTWPAGTPLHFELHTQEQAGRPPGAKAELLTGAAGADSTVRVLGLRLPLDPPSLLPTAT